MKGHSLLRLTIRTTLIIPGQGLGKSMHSDQRSCRKRGGLHCGHLTELSRGRWRCPRAGGAESRGTSLLTIHANSAQFQGNHLGLPTEERDSGWQVDRSVLKKNHWPSKGNFQSTTYKPFTEFTPGEGYTRGGTVENLTASVTRDGTWAW